MVVVKSNTRLSKEEIERRIFEALAPLIGWEIVPDSIQQPAPPQPDILCEVVGRGRVTVELVALDSEETRRRMANMFNTRAAWARALSLWSEAERERLQADLRNAYFSVNFSEDLGTRDRAEIFRQVQQLLLECPNYEGEIRPQSVGTPSGFHGAKLWRHERLGDGPKFSAPSAGYWQGPQINKIVEKLSDKTYVPAAPMELFAYSPHDEPDGAVGSLAAIQGAIAEHLPGSKFERVHVFHLGFLKHVCSMP